MNRMNFRERLAQYANRPNECWEWPGFTVDGYGIVSTDADARGCRRWFAHRAAYTILVGPVSDDLELDHLCRNRRCFNPSHLEPVTPRENTMRSSAPTALNAQKTHCKNGHEFTPENTYIRTTKYGNGRACKTCTIAGANLSRERKRTENPEKYRADIRRWSGRNNERIRTKKQLAAHQ